MRKKWLVPMLIAVLVIGMVGVMFWANRESSITKFWFDEEINVVDGVADITEHTIPFTLTEDETPEGHLSSHSIESSSSPVSPEFQPLYELCIKHSFFIIS